MWSHDAHFTRGVHKYKHGSPGITLTEIWDECSLAGTTEARCTRRVTTSDQPLDGSWAAITSSWTLSTASGLERPQIPVTISPPFDVRAQRILMARCFDVSENDRTSGNDSVTQGHSSIREGLSTGAKIGIGLGVAAFFVLFLAFVFIYSKRHKAQHAALQKPSPTIPEAKPTMAEVPGDSSHNELHSEARRGRLFDGHGAVETSGQSSRYELDSTARRGELTTGREAHELSGWTWHELPGV